MSLSDLPTDILPMIAMCLSKRVPEIDDLMDTCAQLAACGSHTTTVLSRHLAEEVTVRSQTRSSVPDACAHGKRSNKSQMNVLCVAAGIPHRGATLRGVRTSLSMCERHVGKHCPIPVCAALYILDKRWRYISAQLANVVFANRNLASCKSSGRMLLYRHVRRAPLQEADHVVTAQRDVLKRICRMFAERGLTKPWHVRTMADCSYVLMRHALKACVQASGVPMAWCDSFQFYVALNQMCAYPSGSEPGGARSASCTESDALVAGDSRTLLLVSKMQRCKQTLLYMGVDPESLDVNHGDLFVLTRMVVEAELAKPGCFTACRDAQLRDCPSIQDVQELSTRLKGAWGRYVSQEKEFGDLWRYTWAFSVQSYSNGTMQEVIGHAGAFNEFLTGLVRAGITLDESNVATATRIYRSPSIPNVRILGVSLTVLWIQSVLPSIPDPCVLLDDLAAMTTALATIWQGRFPYTTPEAALRFVHTGTTTTSKVSIRKRRSRLCDAPLSIGEVLVVVRDLANTHIGMDLVMSSMRLRNKLIDVVDRNHGEWLHSNGMSIVFGELQGLDAYLAGVEGRIADVPPDIISIARL